MLSNGIILLYDNARPHTVNLMRDMFKRFIWETLQHPPYIPDLSPCDFHIFSDLNKDLRGRRFHSDEEVQEWVRLWVHQRSTSVYKTGIDRLVSQWDKCINTSGNYFWIKQISLSFCSGCSVFIWLPLIFPVMSILDQFSLVTVSTAEDDSESRADLEVRIFLFVANMMKTATMHSSVDWYENAWFTKGFLKILQILQIIMLMAYLNFS